MPELGSYGSVRGALSNERLYRDSGAPDKYLYIFVFLSRLMVGAGLLGLKSPSRRHQMSGTERDASPSLTAFAWTDQDAPYNLNFCSSLRRGFLASSRSLS
jgi:hypothetical protein